MAKGRNKRLGGSQPENVLPGPENFANLLRDPALVIAEILARELVKRGHSDISPALLNVGTHIAPEGSRITELAQRTQLTKATIVRTVDELERLGYAERTPDPEDGRAKLVRGTPRGRTVALEANTIINEIRNAWAGAIGAGELEQLEELLRKLRITLWPQEANTSGR